MRTHLRRDGQGPRLNSMKKFATRSEEIFFACCRVRGWAVTKIEAPGNKRTPDFIVRAGDVTFIAEIKEFHHRTDGKNTGRHRPAQKLRKAINSSRGQLKGHDGPTMLVILDTTDNNYACSENIRAAFLGEGKTRHVSNAQISAIGVLLHENQDWNLAIYLNAAATHPFPPATSAP